MKKNWLAKLGLSLALMLSPMASASAHFLSNHSVDAFRDIDWGGSTKWGKYRDYAHARWDNAPGSVDIYQVNMWSAMDLRYSDAYRRDVSWVGMWTPYFALADSLVFNDYYMYRYDDKRRYNVALHEVGHALGLGHSYSGNVMYSYNTPQSYLGKHDLDDYDSKW